ncbi:MAG: hypothetical protein LUF92_09375 [Clostridiales bacterium]|nr:hypothetical protein [Clostridiales bacterium]
MSGNYVLVELSTDYTTSNYGGSSSGSGDGAGMTGGGNRSGSAAEDNTGMIGGGRGDLDSSETGSETEGTMKERRIDEGDSDNSESESTGTGALDTDEAESNTGDSRMGGGSYGRTGLSSSSASNQFTVTFTQTGEIASSEGTVLEAQTDSCTTEYENNINLLVDNFTQDVFTLSDGTTMMYSLYLPEDYDENTTYPLVLFMPDATGEGSDEYLALTESLGGVIWTTEEWQSEHETIVLVPQYESGNTEDPSYTMELLEEITAQYSVDTSRQYLVGQSSGTIRSIKMLIDYPDEFAGALLVAGQTDEAYTDSIAELSTQNIWMICSEGDARAYPGMTEITEAVEEAGTQVTTTQWSATLSDDEQEQLATEQAEAGTTINWTIFDAETVMNEDVEASDATEHMNTWRVAYNLDTVREWLFEQTK